MYRSYFEYSEEKQLTATADAEKTVQLSALLARVLYASTAVNAPYKKFT